MARNNDNEVLLEDCRILFRNFKGEATRYNREGDRNFCVILSDEKANELANKGWNVKTLKPRDEDEPPRPYLKVSVSYRGQRPPLLVMITSKGRTTLGEDLVGMLDYVDIEKVDLIMRPYNWDVNGKTGITAYLKSIYITIHEDYLELKYADVREIGSAEEFIDAEVVDEYEHPRTRQIEA